ncbi:MAG: sigma-54-dependent Fis family transcriptional regulator [Deltaproteobacteria bacterium]|nr:sigma-54-dependent Fis family transcriptional regulator [Deltaproteobacteria bacterium]
MPTVLVVDDERAIREGLVRAIGSAGHRVVAAAGVRDAREALRQSEVDCVLLDIRLKDGDGLELLGELRRTHPRVPVIMATAYGDSDRAIGAMKAGAFEYLTKPFDFDALLSTVARALRTVAAAPSQQKPAREEPVPALIGSSPRMLEVWKAIGRAAASDAPVLITGESGTGKELVARAVHEHGDRRDEPFVAVNLAALPPTLIESELFGHEKGAFTGAAARREGRFELADRGTIFLDEIGDLDQPLQTKLLRVLQEGTFERVGSATPLSTRARVIAATSRPVDPRTPGVTLREDLFYRLGVIRIEVPPLRERRADVPLLVEGYLRRRAKSPGDRRAVSEAAMKRLVAHDWPGNVRELMHVVERACVMSPAEVLDADDFELGPAGAARAGASPDPESLDLRAAVEALERDFVLRALRRAQGNRAEAARLLGIARPQLYAKMKQLGVAPDEEG